MSFIKDIARIKKLILEAENDAFSIPNMRGLAQEAAEEIKTRTRLGYGVSKHEGPKAPLASLADSTKDNRKRMKIRGELSGATTVGKSNLTATGQMLDSIKGDAVSRGKAIVKLTGTRDGENLSNEKLGEYMEEGSSNRPKRPFMRLSDLQLKRITENLARDIVSRIKRGLTK